MLKRCAGRPARHYGWQQAPKPGAAEKAWFEPQARLPSSCSATDRHVKGSADFTSIEDSPRAGAPWLAARSLAAARSVACEICARLSATISIGRIGVQLATPSILPKEAWRSARLRPQARGYRYARSPVLESPEWQHRELPGTGGTRSPSNCDYREPPCSAGYIWN